MMEFGFFNPLARFVLDRLIGWLRKLDYEAAQRVDFFIANSRNTAERIKKYYNRDSTVIYPWVDLPLLSSSRRPERSTLGADLFQSHLREKDNITLISKGDRDSFVSLRNDKKEQYYLWLGRCIPYKRFDLLVDAFNQNWEKLILCTATDTPLFRELQAKSKPNIEWRFRVSTEEKDVLMAGAKAFLFPPVEDFGLVPIEAMAMGTPVIAYGEGGALETVVDGVTGVFFSPQTSEALNIAIEKSETMEWDREKIREHAEKFSKEKFQENIRTYITTHAK
jgi:glycosyltransferase involved in cell wall biosynthesis